MSEEQSTALETVPRPEHDLAPVRAATGSAWALARMSDEEFATTMAAAKKGRERLHQVMRNMMTEGIHFGKIPGTDKPTLLKPGAEVLCQMFHLVPDVKATVEYGDGLVSPEITVRSRCVIHAGSLDGPAVGTGEAAANSWERKWRYRAAERICPACKKPAIIKGSDKYGGGWVCWKKKDGCGKKWADGAAEIESQTAGLVANPDPYDLLNTITKIANKRAKLDAVITSTSSSDLLTQDMDESVPTPTPAPYTPAEFVEDVAGPPTDVEHRTAEPIFTVPFGKNLGTAVVDLSVVQIEWYLDEARMNLAEKHPRARPYDERKWIRTLEAQLEILMGASK